MIVGTSCLNLSFQQSTCSKYLLCKILPYSLRLFFLAFFLSFFPVKPNIYITTADPTQNSLLTSVMLIKLYMNLSIYLQSVLCLPLQSWNFNTLNVVKDLSHTLDHLDFLFCLHLLYILLKSEPDSSYPLNNCNSNNNNG